MNWEHFGLGLMLGGTIILFYAAFGTTTATGERLLAAAMATLSLAIIAGLWK